MAGFDDPGVFFSDNLANFGAEDETPGQQQMINNQQVKRKFKDFLREYQTNDFNYKYREMIKRHRLNIYLSSDAQPLGTRELKSTCVSRLCKVTGIVVAASGVRSKAVKIAIQCRTCRTVVPNILLKSGLEGYQLPRKCNSEQAGRPKCPLDPYFILPDKCECVDYQILKLQETPESVPYGEMPRHLQLFVDRYLCERTVPGNRVTVMGIYSIKSTAMPGKRTARDKVAVGIRAPYLKVLGIEIDTEGSGRSAAFGQTFTAEEEEDFRRLARSPDCYDKIARSIAPSIFGSADIKKAIACLLFGGSRKRLPDGLTRRGDINVLLLGDPGTAKSQLLKFVEQISPIAVYTSGKGSSAAGLTASVIRDPSSRNFVMEGGAMVLADGGVVCIDEFDKMREDDRVAIHEAMEQQTISIAKAGITTTLNSRCAVLAAANSVFGRWDDTKGEENIDFMPTILSRFDMIFVVKDEHDAARDQAMAKHVMNVHMKGQAMTSENVEGELSLKFLKKYIAYCRSRCGPRLSRCRRLFDFLAMQDYSRPLAKMRLEPFATDSHVDEALRLFQVSTLNAATSGSLAGVEGFTTNDDIETLARIERQLKQRFPIGAQVSEHSILQDFLRQKYEERTVYKVIYYMVRRGELQYRMQRKMLYRIK
ncbi:unnamed protein product [Cyprideis torosa]|uniref:DNA replication licensing factor MCM5 n=1 Tax=Cyprideis torosa TaxID=163714 RepID=A0A7R8W4Z4_9CRUS|nr:unnamed protein product [Cyprideis torosa]CAG0880353.1 unnamed protein product [Cyprideis torosa]